MKLYSSWNIAGTESYRWSAGTNPKGLGTNSQTIPKGLRHLLLAPPGRILVQLDLSQAEARLVAYLANCKGLIDLFNDPSRSVHMENALRIFGYEVEKDSPEYVLAKSVVHASNYREGPYRFSQQTGLGRRESKALLEKYHSVYPEIRRWHEDIKKEIETQGWLRSPLGRTRFFYDAISCRSLTGKITDQQWKEAISWKPQTTVPDITNSALLRIATEMPEVWFHQQGHDSFVVSVDIDALPRVFPILVDTMQRPIPIRGRVLTIPVDGGIGFNWGEMMGYRGGKVVTMEEWREWRDAEVARKPREVTLLKGIYGPLLKDVYKELHEVKEAA